MRSNTAFFCSTQLNLPKLLVFALLVVGVQSLPDMGQEVHAKSNKPSAEESESSAEDAEPAAEESKDSVEDAESSAEETDDSAEESETKEGSENSEGNAKAPTEKKSSKNTDSKADESTKKTSSNKSTRQKKSNSNPEPKKSADSEEEKEKQRIENEEAKLEEAAGAEVEVVDDSEEEEPEEMVEEEAPPVVEETVKEPPKVEKRIIGATATIMEKKSELLFRARVDTGAKSCSLHIEDMKIENESEKMADNIGKLVHFNIKNGKDESHWLEAKIAGYVIIKTSNAADDRKRRYKVPLTFRWKDFEKTVLVTLNNREHMEFPLLLGRNFLKGDFLVDVDIDSVD